MAGAKSELHRCLICSTQYKYSQALPFTEKVKIFEASSKLLKVQKPDVEDLWWNFEEEDLPFCSSCLFSAQLLSDLKSQLDTLQSSIKRTVDRMKVEMINSQFTTPLTRLEREIHFRNQAMAELVPVLQVKQMSNGASSSHNTSGLKDKKGSTEPCDNELEDNFEPSDDDDEGVGGESPIKVEYEWDDDDLMDTMADSPTPIAPSVETDLDDVSHSVSVTHNVSDNSDAVTVPVAHASTSSTEKHSRKSAIAPVSLSTRPRRASTIRKESDGENGTTLVDEVPLDPGSLRADEARDRRRRKKDAFTKILLTEAQLNSYKNYNWKTAGITTPDGREFFHGFELLESEPGKFQCDECDTPFKNKYNLIQHIKFMHLGMTREKEMILKLSDSEGVEVPPKKRRKLELILKAKATKAKLKTLHQRRLNLKRLQAPKRKYKSKIVLMPDQEEQEQGSSSTDTDPVPRRKSARKSASAKKKKPKVSLEEEDFEVYNTCSFRASGVKTPEGKEMFGGIELKKLDDNQYECTVCSNVYKNKYGLCDHIKFVHLGFDRKKDQMIRELKSRGKSYPKIRRDVDGKLKVDLIEVQELPGGLWRCGECGHQLKKKHNIALHIRSIHLGIKLIVNRKPKEAVQGPKTLQQVLRAKTVISEDGRRFYEGVEVIQFEATTDVFKYKCGACSLDFNSTGGILTHIKRRHLAKDSSKRISCPVCGKKFAYLHLLRDHEDMHKLPGHVCENCGLCFKHRSGLTNHIARVHKQVRNHKCDFCGKMFHTRKDCRLHTRTHTKEKPYVCSCSAKFAFLASLKKHQANHGHSNDEEEVKDTTADQESQDSEDQSSSVGSEFLAVVYV